MLSRYLHFGVLENYVSSLFLVVNAIQYNTHIDYQTFVSNQQIVKNILVLRNWQKTTRKQMKDNTLYINAINEFLGFPMLANLTLKKT